MMFGQWCSVRFLVVFFFFKQKTAYEMRISDWSSDVCSSDLLLNDDALGEIFSNISSDELIRTLSCVCRRWRAMVANPVFVRSLVFDEAMAQVMDKIGRASCRERVCQYV